MRLLLMSLLFATIFSPPGASAQSDSEALARRLLNSQGCKACHQIAGEGGTTGPGLDKVGSRLTREKLRDKLANPARRHATGRIADFSHLRAEEIDALVTFLGQLR